MSGRKIGMNRRLALHGGMTVPGLLALLAPALYAATATVDGSVTRVLTADAGRFGGCMAALDVDLADTDLDCSGRWATFGCSGEYTDEEGAYRLFESLRAAVAAGKTVGLRITDEKKHGGFCYADRIVIHDSPYIDEDSDGDGIFDLDDNLPLQPNRPPAAIGKLDDQTLAVDGDDAVLDMSNAFSDPDEDSLSYVAASDDEEVATVGIEGSDLKISPVGKGDTIVTVTVRDPGGLTAQQALSVSVYDVPPNPGNIRLSRVGSDHIRLNWDASPSATHYAIWRCIELDASFCRFRSQWRKIASKVLGTTFLDRNVILRGSWWYGYIVAACNAAGCSSNALSASSATPFAVTAEAFITE